MEELIQFRGCGELRIDFRPMAADISNEEIGRRIVEAHDAFMSVMSARWHHPTKTLTVFTGLTTDETPQLMLGKAAELEARWASPAGTVIALPDTRPIWREQFFLRGGDWTEVLWANGKYSFGVVGRRFADILAGFSDVEEVTLDGFDLHVSVRVAGGTPDGLMDQADAMVRRWRAA